MSTFKVVAIILIAVGVVGLLQGGFSGLGTTHSMALGSHEMSIETGRRLAIPLWLSAAVLATGCVLLLAPQRKSWAFLSR